MKKYGVSPKTELKIKFGAHQAVRPNEQNTHISLEKKET